MTDGLGTSPVLDPLLFVLGRAAGTVDGPALGDPADPAAALDEGSENGRERAAGAVRGAVRHEPREDRVPLNARLTLMRRRVLIGRLR